MSNLQHRQGTAKPRGEKNRGGRPTSYKPEFAAQAQKSCEFGATDREVADFFHVHIATFYRWQHDHEEFRDALKLGKEAADRRVERSLYNRAVGYSYDAVKVFNDKGKALIVPYREHMPPDTTAAMFWLKNRRPERWRDKQQLDHSGKLSWEQLVIGSYEVERAAPKALEPRRDKEEP